LFDSFSFPVGEKLVDLGKPYFGFAGAASSCCDRSKDTHQDVASAKAGHQGPEFLVWDRAFWLFLAFLFIDSTSNQR
jgi:hypothetical protein